MADHKQGAGEATVIEVRTADAAQTHLANLLVSPSGQIKLEAIAQGTDIDRLGEAILAISQKPVLSTVEEKPMKVKGETVNVRTKVHVSKTDPRYPWAVRDALGRTLSLVFNVQERRLISKEEAIGIAKRAVQQEWPQDSLDLKADKAVLHHGHWVISIGCNYGPTDVFPYEVTIDAYSGKVLMTEGNYGA